MYIVLRRFIIISKTFSRPLVISNIEKSIMRIHVCWVSFYIVIGYIVFVLIYQNFVFIFILSLIS